MTVRLCGAKCTGKTAASGLEFGLAKWSAKWSGGGGNSMERETCGSESYGSGLGLETANSLRMEMVIIESDCKPVIEMLKSGVVDLSHQGELVDILLTLMMIDFDEVCWPWVFREAKMAAHKLTHYVFSFHQSAFLGLVLPANEAVHKAEEVQDQDEAEEQRTLAEGMVVEGRDRSRRLAEGVVQKGRVVVARKDHEVVVSKPLFDNLVVMIQESSSQGTSWRWSMVYIGQEHIGLSSVVWLKSVSYIAAMLASKATIDANNKVPVVLAEHRGHMPDQEAAEEAHMMVYMMAAEAAAEQSSLVQGHSSRLATAAHMDQVAEAGRSRLVVVVSKPLCCS
ncbi:hypothetical protein Droror1_Dr00016069 [Drosera rotundifolia]